MSNEKKIMKEMVQGNLKVHRKRNLLLVLAITLTTILFTSVLEIGFGGMQSIQETQLKLSGMKADAELRFLDKEQFQKILIYLKAWEEEFPLLLWKGKRSDLSK